MRLYTIEKTDMATNEAIVGMAKLKATSGIVPVILITTDTIKKPN